MTEPQVDLLIQPQEFFRDYITKAISSQNLIISKDVEFYLVNLLCDFISHEKIEESLNGVNLFETPLALILQQALEAPQDEQIKIYKVLGDLSLYISGYFEDFFNRKTYDISYYINLGSNAYRSVSDLTRHGNNSKDPKVFLELSQQFPSLVEVVGGVADLTKHTENQNILSMYDRWIKTKSERIRKKLEDSGINPLPVDTKKPQ